MSGFFEGLPLYWCPQGGKYLFLFLGLSGLVALSYFASGVYTVIFERLKLKLQTHNVRLEGQEYSSIYSPIIYIGWFSRKHFLI